MEEAAEEGVRFRVEGIDEMEIETKFGGEGFVFAIVRGVGFYPAERAVCVGFGDVSAIVGIYECKFGEKEGDMGGGAEAGV